MSKTSRSPELCKEVSESFPIIYEFILIGT